MRTLTDKQYNDILLKSNAILLKENEELRARISEALACIEIANKKLQRRIDKAIEYIESRANNAGVELMPREKELIKILRGEDNE